MQTALAVNPSDRNASGRMPDRARTSPHRRQTAPVGRSAASRRRSFDFGVAAEKSVACYLHAGGYTILGSRERTRGGEVDLIAVRDDTVAFVEVKARRRGYDGLEAVTRTKQARISAAADDWLSRNPAFAEHTLRFDVALVWPGMLDYLENAFDAVSNDDFVW
ncbi:YraN family protein [Acuticoccus sp. M5D2P5]|uniref:YraN family protein n=1 Tax=Acuticoccus kalidii TaxID=2910977 RepID=UPI001F291F59|nr:YraN family protein [Acuticoccus kalidii]MCF3936281.1 YraN family protein [Acuticoccus kalidii]